MPYPQTLPSCLEIKLNKLWVLVMGNKDKYLIKETKGIEPQLNLLFISFKANHHKK